MCYISARGPSDPWRANKTDISPALDNRPGQAYGLPMSNLHAHISTASADCDGSYSRTSVETLRDDEKANDFGFLDLDFKARVAGDLISMHSPGATLKVTEYGVEYHEDTEEGFVHTEVTWCEDECQAKSTRRDHRAEAAGY